MPFAARVPLPVFHLVRSAGARFVRSAGASAPASLAAAACAAALLATARSAAFVWWPHAAFDSDQAIVGLMAKHVAEGRALPVTFYGQTYMLAVEAYLAAPLFAVGGASVPLLKLPLLAINAAVAAMLVALLTRDAGLRPGAALAASAFFTACTPVTGAYLVAAMGGSVEPFLYVLLIWMTRRQPLLCGAVAGFGFLHREFSLYGLTALVAVEALGEWRAWRALLPRVLAMLAAFMTVLALGNAATRFGDIFGPEMPRFELPSQPSSVAAVTSRAQCEVIGEIGPNVAWLVSQNLPTLAGTRERGLDEYYVGQPAPAAPVVWALLAVGLLLGAGRATFLAWRGRTPPPSFVVFLALVGGQAIVVYTGSCGVRDPTLIRYTLLALLLPVAVSAWHLGVEPVRVLRRSTLMLLVGWMAWSGARHLAVIGEYVERAPETPQSRVAAELERRGIQHARAGYWVAHYVTFVTGERVRMASDYPARILIYDTEVSRAGRSVNILPGRCPNGTEVGPLWICE
ncbi:MAG: hypothetical protein IT177_02755 [Acidobacteria bacterium]|nr:hypothetical protein [Acidobacteriota bacterium]